MLRISIQCGHLSVCACVCSVHSAFDTLSKVFNPSEEGIEHRLTNKSLQCVSGTTIHLIGRDQDTPIIEVEGPLLTDSHVGFKVGELALLNTIVFNNINIIKHQCLTWSWKSLKHSLFFV